MAAVLSHLVAAAAVAVTCTGAAVKQQRQGLQIRASRGSVVRQPDDTSLVGSGCDEESEACPPAWCATPPGGCHSIRGDLVINVNGSCCPRPCQISCATSTASMPEPRALQAGDTIWLRAHTGKYLSVEGTEVHAKWNERLSWEAFVIEKASSNSGNIDSGDSIYLRAHTGRFVEAQGTTVQATWDQMGSWQRFVIEKTGANSRIYPYDTIYLKAHTGKHVSVNGTKVHAQWENQGLWEALRLESDDAAGRVAQDTGYTGADNGTSWEYFEG